MEPELDLPRELEFRLVKILVEDIDTRVKDLTYLVALQENELVLHSLMIIGLLIYIYRKESHAR
jgi:hypothetical protein